MTVTLESLSELAGRLGSADNLIHESEALEPYRHDATTDRGNPVAVVLARTEDDVLAVLEFCREHNVPVVPRGAGTGLSGGAVPPDGAIVLSTEQMDDLSVMPSQRLALCGPGVITRDVVDMAAGFGLTYPPDPASFEESSIGGNVAENAGGLRCVKYGVTRDYVVGLRAVTMEGRIVTTGIFAEQTGFDVHDLLIGSEGTLAVVTQIAVRLIPSPIPGDTVLAAFGSPEDAARTVSDVVQAGIVPTVMEFLDGDAAECSNRYEETEGLDAAAAILLFEVSGAQAGSDVAERVVAACRRNSCSYIRAESDQSRAERLWRVRRNLSKAIKAAAPIRISEDVAVPISQFPVLVAFVAAMNTASSLRINAFGHAGDGNLHVSFLAPTGAANEKALIEREVERLMRKTIELGGTLSGEHGIGLAKRRHLGLEFNPATIQVMAHLKTLFDPAGLLNPGKIFPS